MVVFVATMPAMLSRRDQFQNFIQRLEGKIRRNFDQDRLCSDLLFRLP